MPLPYGGDARLTTLNNNLSDQIKNFRSMVSRA